MKTTNNQQPATKRIKRQLLKFQCKKILVLLLLISVISCGKKTENIETSAANVEVVQLVKTDFVMSYKGPAYFEGWKVANLGPEFGGRLIWIGVEAGDRVRKGEPLFKIDSSLQSAQSLEAAARLEDARVAAKNANENYLRIRKLFEEGIASQQELDNALTVRDRTAESVSAAAAAGKAISASLGKTVVTAPFDGIITRKDYEVGEVVGNNSRVVCIEDISILKAVVNLPEREISGIKENLTAVLRLTSGKSCTGIVSLVSPAADQISRTIRVEIRVDSFSAEFRSGLFAEAEIVREIKSNSLVIPKTALIEKSNGDAIVYVAENGIARKRLVKIDGSDDYSFLVIDGLKEGELVITSGVSKLADGMKIEIIKNE